MDIAFYLYIIMYLCYLLPSSFKIFVNVLAFLYVKASFCEEKNFEEISFPSIFQKNADVSIFVEIQG